MRHQNRTGRAKRPKIRRPRRTKPQIRCPRSLAGVSTFVVSYSSQPKVLSFYLALGAMVPGVLCFWRGIFESLFFHTGEFHDSDAARGSCRSRL
jgi:hypothetical protein